MDETIVKREGSIITRVSSAWVVCFTAYISPTSKQEYSDWFFCSTEEEADAKVASLLETPGTYVWKAMVTGEFHNVR